MERDGTRDLAALKFIYLEWDVIFITISAKF